MGNVERLGVSKVQLIVNEELGWIFREQHEEDYGIDAQIEIRGKGYPTGRLLGVQIKSGKAYFSEATNEYVIFRFDAKHYHYWSNFPFKVLLVLYSPTEKECFWEVVDTTTVSPTRVDNYKIIIPKSNKFNISSKNRLLLLAYDNSIKQLAYDSYRLFEPNELRTFYSILNKQQRKTFQTALEELRKPDFVLHGFPFSINKESAISLAEATMVIYSEQYTDKTQDIEDNYIRKNFDDAYLYVQNFLNQGINNCLVILGPAGIGKSTLANKIHDGTDKDSTLITGRLLSTNVEKLTIESLCCEAKKLLILDGWDEILPENQSSIESALTQLILNKQEKIIITSRYLPNFLNANHQILKLEPLTVPEIIVFLRRAGVLDTVRYPSFYSMARVVNTPLLLNIMVHFCKQMNVSADELTGAHILYSRYLHYPHDLRCKLKDLAYHMFLHKKINMLISGDEISFFEDCQELILSDDKKYVSFLHVGFYEFFLALSIYEKVFVNVNTSKEYLLSVFSNCIPTLQTLKFLAFFIEKNGVSNENKKHLNNLFHVVIESIIPGTTSNFNSFLTNAANLFYSVWHFLLYINKYFHRKLSLNVTDKIVEMLPLMLTILSKNSLSGMHLDFSDVNIKNLDLSRCHITNINFNNSTLHCVNFESSCLDGCSFENADLTTCRLVRADMRNTNLRNVILQNADVRECMISENYLDDILIYRNSLVGLESLIIRMDTGEYMTYSQYSDS